MITAEWMDRSKAGLGLGFMLYTPTTFAYVADGRADGI